MTISVPTSLVVLDTDVEDSTLIWDKSVFYPNFPSGLQFQHNDKIYENVSNTVQVQVYDAGANYEIGDIVYNGGNSGVTTKVDYGTLPKQPQDYVPLPSVGWDPSTWTTRYAKLQDIPPASFPLNFSRTKYVTWTVFSSNGLHFYEQYTDGWMNAYTLSSAWDLSTATPKANQRNWGVAGYSRDFRMRSNGTKCYLLWISSIIQYSVTTPYDPSSTLTQDGTQVLGANSFTFSADGTKLYIGYYANGDVLQYNLGNAWDITTGFPASATHNLSTYVSGLSTILGTSVKSVQFSPDGTKLYAMGSLKRAVQFNLTTAWDISTASIEQFKPFKYFTYIHWRGDGAGVVGCDSTRAVRQMWVPTAWDIEEGIYSLGDHNRITTYGTYHVEHIWFLSDLGAICRVWNADFSAYEYLTSPGSVLTYFTLDNESLDLPAILETVSYGQGWNPKTLISQNGALYVRTHLDITAETITSTDEIFYPVENPIELPGFTYLEATNDGKPFDDINYTAAKKTGSMYYLIQGAENFDTLAIGNIKAEHVRVEFRPPGWTSDEPTTATIDIDLDTHRDNRQRLAHWKTTLIFYSSPDGNAETSIVMEPGSTVLIEITGPEIEVASIMLGMSALAGMSNLQMTNKYRDFSVFEYDVWGNASYTERAKVASYTGTVDIPISDYDTTDRLMMSLGKQLVIINGSDWDARNLDPATIFAATQKIGRFLSFQQKTAIRANDIDPLATYDFNFEEIV